MIKYLNLATERSRAEVVALVGEDDAHLTELMQLGGIDRRVEDSASLIGEIDALIVTNRDGALHADQAIPFLAAGKPVWVDKPLACSTNDARRMIAEAVRTGTPLASYSPLRWVPDVENLAKRRDSIGELQALTVIGPADPRSEYGGIFFYGIHCADVAQRLAPGEPTEFRVSSIRDTVIIRYLSGEVDVTLQLVKPDDHQRVPFHASVTGRHGVVSSEIALGPGYVEPGIGAFLGMLGTGAPPVPYQEILRTIVVIEAAAHAFA
ncbi:Gfo/Idh/MocA family protein [Microlunatus sp. Gsoil 973]|uniref:Gfo/Idh/MocA family protein n=1 Tax=Microlunatus sp. Gsoil 973 TaxID=2672569 RepID=UPI0012B4B4F7|nr:Gfo/Idh/MocA family oxidoreductase [Microlunatus sp. Gsoil 973]QGN34184.1 hypothetical protein GJV80_16685 [Microlunatus sp. Gsoil 973]